MTVRIGAFDWRSTPLRPIGAWPQNSKTAVELMLASHFASALVWGPAGILLYNDALAKIIGSQHPVAFGTSFLVSFPEAGLHVITILEQAWAGETVRVDHRLIPYQREDGVEDAWFTACFSPVRDERGAIVAVSAVVIEASDRVRADRRRDQVETNLREREERYRLIIDVATDYAILTADAENRIESWSPGAEANFGWTAEEAIGQPLCRTRLRTMSDEAHPGRGWRARARRDYFRAPGR